MSASVFDDLRALQVHYELRADISPRHIKVHHAVPHDRIYPQWNTQGQLILWANRQRVADALPL